MDQPILSLAEITANATSAEHLLNRLRPGDAIAEIEWVEGILKETHALIRRNDLDSLKLYSDIQFRKLNKILPDVKATDHRFGDTASKVNFVINLGPPTPPPLKPNEKIL